MQKQRVKLNKYTMDIRHPVLFIRVTIEVNRLQSARDVRDGLRTISGVEHLSSEYFRIL